LGYGGGPILPSIIKIPIAQFSRLSGGVFLKQHRRHYITLSDGDLAVCRSVPHTGGCRYGELLADADAGAGEDEAPDGDVLADADADGDGEVRTDAEAVAVGDVGTDGEAVAVGDWYVPVDDGAAAG
jgi:hypothetical protein